MSCEVAVPRTSGVSMRARDVLRPCRPRLITRSGARAVAALVVAATALYGCGGGGGEGSQDAAPAKAGDAAAARMAIFLQ